MTTTTTQLVQNRGQRPWKIPRTYVVNSFCGRLARRRTPKKANVCTSNQGLRDNASLGTNSSAVSELKTWLGLLLAMGLVQKNGRVAEYWSTHWLTQTPGFDITMSSLRFLHILRFLHFVDNEGATLDEGIEVLAYLNKTFSVTFNPRW